MTGLDIVNEIRKLAEEQPDFVYESNGRCQYTSGNNCCGCGVGQAILRLDPSKRFILEMIDGGGEKSFSSIASVFILSNDVYIKWISSFQRYQDHNNTWKDSVELADLNSYHGE